MNNLKLKSKISLNPIYVVHDLQQKLPNGIPKIINKTMQYFQEFFTTLFLKRETLNFLFILKYVNKAIHLKIPNK